MYAHAIAITLIGHDDPNVVERIMDVARGGQFADVVHRARW